MSAQTCPSPTPAFGSARQPAPVALLPSAPAQPAQMADRQDHAARPSGWLGALWAAYRKRRAESRLRNLAADMDPHILQDVGAPSWLVNETTLERELARLKHMDYMRW